MTKMNIVDDYSNWKVAKKMLTTKLVNKSRNSSSVYRSAKGYGFPDLVIVPIMEVNISGIKGSVTINDDHIESWGISKRTVIDTAIKNTECEIKKLDEVLCELRGMSMEEMEMMGLCTPIPFYYISNSTGCLGASAIIKAKERLMELFPDGYYVLPSSINEVLVVPKEEERKHDINDLINDVNTSILDPQSYLSDHVYTFNVA